MLLTLLGLLYYTITQGSQFVALSLLPATNFSVLLNGTALVVAVLGIYPAPRNTNSAAVDVGMLVFLAGVALFFFSLSTFPPVRDAGYLVAGRAHTGYFPVQHPGARSNRDHTLRPLTVTTISMGIGSALLLGIGLAVEPAPRLDLSSGLMVLWLAVVNTAVAFTLWNKTLRTLTATESSVINNTMLIQIALLAWLFLGERLTLPQIAGLLIAFFGALVVQLRPRSAPLITESVPPAKADR